ncbi:spherulin-1B precursor, partial [Metarhizium majus ARSEF 297]
MHLTALSSLILLAGVTTAAPSKRAGNSSADINAVLPPVVKVNTRADNVDLIAKLMTAPTQADRLKLLDQPGDFVFDFNVDDTVAGSEAKGKGGATVSATSKTFPALVGNGAAMTVGFLGPCGMNTPHVHNRATELNFVAQGRLVTNFVEENGATPVSNTLTKFQMAVFPQGAIHVEFNPDCTDTVFVAGFNNADPGVQTIAQNFFSLRPDIVSATLGGVQSLNGADIESFRGMIPANVALGIDTIDPAIRLRRAIHVGDSLLAIRILKSHPPLLHNPDSSLPGLSNSNLHLAASLGHKDICEALLKAGHEDPCPALNDNHQTALMLAASAGHSEVVHLLCEYDRSCILRRDVRGRDAIMEASMGGHDTALQILLTYVPGGPREAVQRADLEGNTALHFASSNGNLLGLRTLLAAGADVERRNIWNWTPAAYSATVQSEVYLKGLVTEVERRQQLKKEIEATRHKKAGAVRVVTADSDDD